MEVLDANEAVLSNYEVLNFLREERGRLRSGKKKAGGTGVGGAVATVILETQTALEATPAKTQSKESVRTFMKEMSRFNLTQSEKLMILNHCPETAVEIHLFVEESEERLSEDQAEEILRLVKTILLPEEEEPKPEAGEEGVDSKEEEKSVSQ